MGLKHLKVIGLFIVSTLCCAQSPGKVHLIPSDDSRFNTLLSKNFIAASQRGAILSGKAELVLSESPFAIKAITVKYLLRYADGHEIQTFRTVTPRFIGSQRLPGNPILLEKDQTILVSPYASLQGGASEAEVSTFLGNTIQGFAYQGQVDKPIVAASIDTVIFDGGFIAGKDESGTARKLSDQRNAMIAEAQDLLALGYNATLWKAKLDEDAEIKTTEAVDSRLLAKAEAAVEFRKSLANLGPDRFGERIRALANSRRMEQKRISVMKGHKDADQSGQPN